MPHNDIGYKTFAKGAGANEYLRVTYADDGLTVVPADKTQAGLGGVFDAPRHLDVVTVSLWNKPGTQELMASEPIPVGKDVYAADDGKISLLPAAAGNYIKIGKANTAAISADDVIEVIPQEVGQYTTVTA